jgi:hypothetical protein
MSVIDSSQLLATGDDGYQISRSVRLRSSASAYLNRTGVATPTNNKIFTVSKWVKRGTINDPSVFETLFGGASSQQDTFGFGSGTNNAGDSIQLRDANVGSYNLLTTQVFRDPSSWYHLVLSVDTTQATAANRVKLYVNGTQVTSFSTATYPSQNYVFEWNAASTASVIGRRSSGNSSWYFDGYLTEVNFIDGQALTPASFGETDVTTGVWKPKKYAGTYGTNGFYLNFSDNSAATAAAIGKDSSGNGNNWTPNNISLTAGATYDSMIDVPTPYADGGNGRGNYCVLNTLDKNANVSVLDGNLNMNTSAVNYGVRASIGVNSGKWYWEVFVSAIGSTNVDIGVADSAWSKDYVGSSASSWGYFSSGQKYNNGSAVSYGATYTTNDIIGVAFDADNQTLTFYKNGVSQGQAYSGVAGSNPIFPAVSGQTSSTLICNFGQRPFAYTPPTGFKALNTFNLPDPTIKKGNAYFDVALWTGDGGSTKTISGLNFQPDFIWSKERDIAQQHVLVDSVRGAGYVLDTSSASADYTATTYGQVSSFNSNGFTASKGSDPTYSFFNKNTGTYVGWQWKKGATPGFDIVTYTGIGSAMTVPHSLGVAPKMVIVKNRNSAGFNWVVWHASLPSGAYYLNLNGTAAQASDTTVWNNTTPTSAVFSIGTSPPMNTNGNTQVAYLFAEVAGFSKFGSYTGNGSADGPFVFCGFRPKFILFKSSSNAQDWVIYDTARDTFNVATKYLLSNSSAAEASYQNPDILSNGFKMRDSASLNFSGWTYIFAAFAENPFKYSLAR